MGLKVTVEEVDDGQVCTTLEKQDVSTKLPFTVVIPSKSATEFIVLGLKKFCHLCRGNKYTTPSASVLGGESLKEAIECSWDDNGAGI